MAFDPYYSWLGIRPEEQPPNYYRLLGLTLFEDNPAVIENAADRQMAHIRTFQSGKNGADSQRLLNEIAAARITLLTPQRRIAYDAQLQANQVAAAAPVVVVMPQAVASPQLAQSAASPAMPAFAPAHAASSPSSARKRRQKNPLVEVAKIIGGGVAGIVLSVLILRYVALIDITGMLPLPEPEANRQVVQRDPSPKLTANPSDPVVPQIRATQEMPRTEPPPAVAKVDSTNVDPIETPVPRVKAKYKGKGKGQQIAIAISTSTTGATIAVSRMQPIPIGDDPAYPAELRGGTRFDWIERPKDPATELGRLEFTVEQPGVVYLIADWNYQGNANGSWRGEAKSKDDLIAGGWQYLGRCPWEGTPEKPVELFKKFCAQGESHVIRVNKYWPPLPVLPPGGTQPAGSSAGSATVERTLWVHSTGSFRQTSPGSWEESNKDWNHKLQFAETNRTDEYIEIIRAPQITVRLYADRSESRRGDNPFKLLHRGSWQKSGSSVESAVIASAAPASAAPSAPAPTKPAVMPANRLRVPSADEQAPVKKALEELYGISKLKSPQDQRKAGEELRDVGRGAKDKPAEQFVALRQAAELAQNAGDARLAAECLDLLAQRFEFDYLIAETQMLERLAQTARSPEQIESLVLAARPAIWFAISDGRFDVAKRLADATVIACNRPNGQKLRKFVGEGQKEVSRKVNTWQTYQAALEKLKSQPNDSAANLTAGRWLCLERGDWQAALPHLAKGGSPLLQAAAVKHYSAPTDDADLVGQADAWYAAGQGPPEESLALVRALLLYQRAKLGRLDGLESAKVDRRIEELSKRDDLKSLAEQAKQGRSLTGLSKSLPQIARRHCILLFSFEAADLLAADNRLKLLDLSGNGNHGEVHGTELALGQAGSAFAFNGQQDFVECKDQPSLNSESGLTICAWIKVASFVHPSGADDIVSKDDWNGRTGQGYTLRLHDRLPDFNFGSGSDWLWVRGNQPPDLGTWIHLAGVYNGEHQAMFVNGVEVHATPCTKPISVSKSALRIGRGPFAQERRLHGAIDEVAVFDIGLAAGEVRAIYELGKAGTSLSH